MECLAIIHSRKGDVYTALHLLGLVNRVGGSRYGKDVRLFRQFLELRPADREIGDVDQIPTVPNEVMLQRLAIMIVGWLNDDEVCPQIAFLARNSSWPEVRDVAYGALVALGSGAKQCAAKALRACYEIATNSGRADRFEVDQLVRAIMKLVQSEDAVLPDFTRELGLEYIDPVTLSKLVQLEE
ncbi:MAG: hypothetical protein IT464_03330 [Planctomycetes bacterium]|nr:hypothetical protein [Planctomycetota bacterium]